LQHISEGDGEQRHIIIIKNTPTETNTKKKMIKNEEEEINEQFRSFSVLEEEEKKDSIQKIDKNTKSSKKISEQNLISTENNEEKVRIKTFQ
jgi:hypothetical protein